VIDSIQAEDGAPVTDRLRGLKARAQRRREHNDKHFPRMLALWRRELTHPEIAAELNKDSRNCDGHAWTANGVRDTLFARTDPVEYAALAKATMARGNAAKSTTRAYADAAASPRAIELLKTGLTYEMIAERLQAEGYSNVAGAPWKKQVVEAMLRRRYSLAELAAMRPGGKTRAPLARLPAAEEFERAIVPRVVAMWKEDPSLERVVQRLNAAGEKNFLGREWNATLLRAILRRRLDVAEYAALARASHRQRIEPYIEATIEANKRRARRHDKAIRPRILELKQAGRTHPQIAERLNEEAGDDATRLNHAGRPWVGYQIGRLLRRTHGVAALGDPPVKLGEPGEPVQVLGIDGQYREKSLGGGRNGKSRRFVVEALLKAGPGGLSVAELVAIAPGARSVIKTFLEDPDWAGVIYPPDKAAGIGRRIGPPRPIIG